MVDTWSFKTRGPFSLPVGALQDRSGSLSLGGGVGRALVAVGLLGFVLVEAAGAELALVEAGVEEGAGLADGQGAVALRSGAGFGGGEAVGATFAGQVDA